MGSRGAITFRWFLVGLGIGVIAGILAGSFHYWLNRTEEGHTFCRAVAYQQYPDLVKVQDLDLAEAARLGRPAAFGLGLCLIALFSWIILYFLVKRSTTGEPAASGAASETSSFRWLALVAAIVGSAIPIVAAVMVAEYVA